MKRIKTSRCEDVREFYSAEYSEEDFKKEVEKEKIKFLDMETTFDNLIKIFKDYDYNPKMEYEGYNWQTDEITKQTISIFEYFTDIIHDLCWDAGIKTSSNISDEDYFEFDEGEE